MNGLGAELRANACVQVEVGVLSLTVAGIPYGHGEPHQAITMHELRTACTSHLQALCMFLTAYI